jgi:hypothetical protein
LERQISAVPPKFEVAQGLEYRIQVVPENVHFDPNDAASVHQAEIRKYPASGYATTNGEGEFYQHDPQMLYNNDQVIIEFRVAGESYYSNPATPTLPFSSFTIAKADSFNDFVTGQVNPIRSINWEAPADAPPEDQYQWTYCSGALVNLSQYLSLNYNQHVPTGDLARAMTDEWGNFDTRRPPVSPITGQPLANDGFDVYETPSGWGSLVGYDVSLNYHQATTTGKVLVRTTLEISFDRTIQQVPGSQKTYEENGKIINQVQYDESIWIVNPNGTRTVTSDEFRYNRVIFSTQDLGRDTDYRKENGVATFAIDTGLSEGQKVQIYRYDAQAALASSGSALPFTLIASDVAVGKDGLVTYKNNTMSEYLVTTKKLDGVVVSDMVALQDDSTKKPMTGWIIGGVVMLLLAGAGGVMWRRSVNLASIKGFF